MSLLTFIQTYSVEIFFTLWTILSVWGGFQMGKKAKHKAPKEFSFFETEAKKK